MTSARARLPYRLTVIAEFTREESRGLEVALEQANALIHASVKAGDIPGATGVKLLAILTPAATRNSNSEHVTNLLLNAGMDVAQAEVDRIRKVRREIANEGKK